MSWCKLEFLSFAFTVWQIMCIMYLLVFGVFICPILLFVLVNQLGVSKDVLTLSTLAQLSAATYHPCR